MIYFNIQQPQAQPTDNSHLTLVRRNLAIALDKNSRLTTMLGEAAGRIAELEETLSDCMFDWQGAEKRVKELTAENATLRKEVEERREKAKVYL